jgi:catechol 2,3-dioxygenase-like lactoylglutathione lyase family enzyme
MRAIPRGIDHLVLAVRDLDAAATTYEALGFTVSARGIHPWGTWNRLVQFEDRTFLELLTIGEPDKIAAPSPGAFSFGAFNRDRLAEGEGMSMLSLTSQDAAADLDAFRAAGLPTFAPFRFQRVARAPDGSERQVAFRLAFTADPAAPSAGVFTCQHEFPDNLWRAELQRHGNGAIGVAAVALVADDPAAHWRFLAAATGADAVPVEGGETRLRLANAALDVLTPRAFERRFGRAPASPTGRFAAVTIVVRDLGSIDARFAAAGRPARRQSDLVVTEPVHGVVLAFRENPYVQT